MQTLLCVNFIRLHHATFRGHHATFRQHHARIMLASCHILPTSYAHVPALASQCSHHMLAPCHIMRTSLVCLHTCGAVLAGDALLAVSEAAGVASRASYRLPVPPSDSNGAVLALHAPKRALPVAGGTLPRRARNWKSGRRCQQRAWGGCICLPRPVTPLP